MGAYPVISADSHITEAPNTYSDYIEPAWRDRAPRLVDGGESVGDLFVIDGMDRPVPMGLVAAAGKPAEEIRVTGVRFDQLHRGGWDPEARLADQERDGVAAEVIYPTVGMQLCNHPDFDYKKACFDAYNRWIAEYCAGHPDRLIGCGQTAMRSPAEGIADLEAIKALGLRGVMMPGDPAVEDYDSAAYDPFWEAAIDLGLPLSFHILTTRSERTRGPRMNSFLSVVRGCQDIMGMLVLGGVFERHPDLRVVCVEADAGWVPHFMYRMDHAYKRHRYWLPPGQALSRLPSEYFADGIYVTFQDDWTAFRFAGAMNWRRLMWANDFPHSDSTWPWSQELLAEHTATLSEEQRRAILCQNVADLYRIDTEALTAGGAHG
ncbi:MAG TPA: amidohydrolase family protein [Acidimicrobiales bacterium]|nr:amidohydrolase family protein [Acidimicrobiales bacterium]